MVLRNPIYTVGWPRGEAAACKAVYTGSNPVPTSVKTLVSGLGRMQGAIGAAVARFPDTEEVTGSIPVSPTCSSSPELLFSCPVACIRYGRTAKAPGFLVGCSPRG